MRLALYLLSLLASVYSYSQTRLQGYIKDARTREALPFCAILLKNTTTGCLSNEEGLFSSRRALKRIHFLSITSVTKAGRCLSVNL